MTPAVELHGHDLTGGDGQVKTVDGTDVGERLGQAAELNDVFNRASSLKIQAHL